MPLILGIDTSPDDIVASSQIVNDSIIDADINSAAAIVGSKIVSATNLVAGVVDTGAQTFAGAKTFLGTHTVQDSTSILTDTGRAIFSIRSDRAGTERRWDLFVNESNGALVWAEDGTTSRFTMNEGGHTAIACATASTVTALDITATNTNNNGLVCDIANTTANRDILRATSGGTTRWRVNGLGQALHSVGTGTDPSISFEGDDDSGFYRVAGGNIGFSSNTTNTVRFTANGIQTSLGDQANPSHSFFSDDDTGMYRSSTDTIGFTTNATLKMTITTAAVNLLSGMDLNILGGSIDAVVGSIAADIKRTGTSNTGAMFVRKNDNTSTSDNRFIEFRFNSDATAGSIRLNGGNLEVSNTSDRRIKSNIEDLSPSLAKIMTLVPRQYNLKSDGGRGVGFVAQELYETYPELVSKTDDGVSEEFTEPWQIGTTGLIPYMVKAMQEQQEEINELRQEIKSLKTSK